MVKTIVTEDDYVTYYSSMWNELIVVAPELKVTLRFNNSKLVEDYPDYNDRENFIKAEILKKYQEQNP